MYKKVYIEITNDCNLACSFCIKNKRIKKYMSFDEFKIVLDKLKGYTKYIYLHVLGEPLMHPNINEFINYASKFFKVNITTNGYLINNIKDNKNIRQINISLQSFDDKYGINIDDYLDNIFDSVDTLSKYSYISYRFWVKNKFSKYIIDRINKKYNVNLNIDNIKNNTTITNNIFISTNSEFIWPSLNNDYCSEEGTCYALRDHIGILSNGTIIPCCLDSTGTIKLGNIFNDNICDIKSSKKYKDMLDGFKNNKKVEELCKHCNFIK